MIEEIYEEGKKAQVLSAQETNAKREERFSSIELNRKPHNSREKLAELAGVSPASIGRAKCREID